MPETGRAGRRGISGRPKISNFALEIQTHARATHSWRLGTWPVGRASFSEGKNPADLSLSANGTTRRIRETGSSAGTRTVHPEGPPVRAPSGRTAEVGAVHYRLTFGIRPDSSGYLSRAGGSRPDPTQLPLSLRPESAVDHCELIDKRS